MNPMSLLDELNPNIGLYSGTNTGELFFFTTYHHDQYY